MNVHKVELLIVDFDGVGAAQIKDIIENIKYPNRCISPDVMRVQTVDISEWDDDHPLNLKSTQEAEYTRLFNLPNTGGKVE